MKYLLVATILLASHGFVYYKGRVDKEREIASSSIEQIQEDAVDNAERIEAQVTRLNETTTALRRQAAKVEEAISGNEKANLNSDCNTSDDELREFNEAVRAANSGVPADRRN